MFVLNQIITPVVGGQLFGYLSKQNKLNKSSMVAVKK